jgi:hypothetical protein
VAAIDFHALGQVVWVSVVAGVGVTVLFSFVIFGTDKARDARRGGQEGQAVLYSAIAVVCMLIFSAAVVFAIVVMLNKS